jgi:cytochrome o ubiquinol oxidase operon protein cyoD
MSYSAVNEAAETHHHHAEHGSLKSYLIGFGLSLILTFASFGLVMSGTVSPSIALPGVIVLCVAQLFVQLICFLHMGRSQRDNVTTFVFTVLVVAIIVGGSAWVLHNMNLNMMGDMMSR